MNARPRAAPSLRATMLLLLVAGVAYVAGISVYLVVRVGPQAASLQAGTEPILTLFSDLTERGEDLERTALTVRGLLAEPRVDSATLRELRTRLARAAPRPEAQPFATAPPDMRVVLARADDDISRLETGLVEIVSLIELGERDRARARFPAVDSLVHRVQRHLGQAQLTALQDLIERERELASASQRALKAFVIWVVIGILLVPLVLWVGHRRIAQPLSELESGVTRVAEGDMNAELPVRYDDEVGQVTAHFNQMTRVLRKRAEEQGRFVTGGELLAGVAHEVNNPLMAILTVASSALDDPDLTEEQRQDLERIVRQARRAGQLVSGMLRFLRPDEPRTADADLNDILRRALNLVSHQFKVEEITLVDRLTDGLPRVRVDPGRLEQVFVNLLSNAIDALRQIEPPRRLIVASWTEQGQVHAMVGDNGYGVVPAIADQLFQPFVTTKGRRGTGLGLYISRQILRESGGDLKLISRAGEGAKFVASLPPSPTPSERPARPSGEGAEPAMVPDGGEFTVLIADDESAIRDPLARYLTRKGHHILEAEDGEEALAVLEDRDVDVVLADLRMPRMDGLDLYRRLRDTNAPLARRVLFLSGDISRLADQDDLDIPGDRVITKPVQLADLERIISRVARGAVEPVRED